MFGTVQKSFDPLGGEGGSPKDHKRSQRGQRGDQNITEDHDHKLNNYDTGSDTRFDSNLVNILVKNNLVNNLVVHSC